MGATSTTSTREEAPKGPNKCRQLNIGGCGPMNRVESGHARLLPKATKEIGRKLVAESRCESRLTGPDPHLGYIAEQLPNADVIGKHDEPIINIETDLSRSHRHHAGAGIISREILRV